MKLLTLLLSILIITSCSNESNDKEEVINKCVIKDRVNIPCIQQLADSGNIQAQAQIGIWYSQGKFVGKDLAKAENYLTTAFLGGDAKSSLVLAYVYGQMAKEPSGLNPDYLLLSAVMFRVAKGLGVKLDAKDEFMLTMTTAKTDENEVTRLSNKYIRRFTGME